MYERFFGLNESPFSLTPDPRFIFASRSHDEALAHLRYWVEHREGFAMITGEVGTGKTTALFRLIEGMARHFEIAFLTNSNLTATELLEEICRRFRLDIEKGNSKPALLQRFEAWLVHTADMGHGAVLIIDEAQNFDPSLLEEIRLLSNITRPAGPPLLQIALVGQPELDRRLSQPELRQLRQRIGVHYRIEPLSRDETVRYVHHRVGVAGGSPAHLFPTDTINVIYERTHGLPREINQVASQALVHAYVDAQPTVWPSHILSAIDEMQFRSVLDRKDGASVTLVPVSEAEPRPLPRVPAAAPPQAPVAEPPRAWAPVAEPTLPPLLRPATPPSRPLLDPLAQVPPGAAAPPRASAMPEPPPVAAPPPRPVAPAPPAPTPPVAPPPSMPSPAAKPPPPAARPGPQPPTFQTIRPVSEHGGRKPRVSFDTLRLYVLGAAAVVILGVAALLMFGSQKPKRDELADMSSEKTLPQMPTGTTTPMFSASDRNGTSRGAAQPARGADSTASLRSDPTVTPAGSPSPGTAVARTPAGLPPTNPPAAVAAGSRQAPPPATGDRQPAAPVAPAAVSARAYRLQVASVRDSTAADSLGKWLAAQTGFPYQVRLVRTGEGSWFVLFLGSFGSATEAETARAQVMQLNAHLTGVPLVRSTR